MQPVLRFDADGGGFWDQPGYYNGQPPKYLDGNRLGVPNEGLNMRRARLRLQGTFLRDFTYNFTWELAPGVGKQFEPGKNSRLFRFAGRLDGVVLGHVARRRLHADALIEYSMSSFELPLLERPAIINIAASLASGTSRNWAGRRGARRALVRVRLRDRRPRLRAE